MKYQETIKEKKYKPLFGYGYEPRMQSSRGREIKQPEIKYNAFGNVIYDLPVEAEADIEVATHSATGDCAEAGNETGEDTAALQMPANGFEKPAGNPLMGVVIAVSLLIALFLIAVIMSLSNPPETAKEYQNQIVMDLSCGDLE